MSSIDQPKNHFRKTNLVHLADETVDGLLAVAKVTTLNEVLELAGTEATSGVAELERPEEVGGLLEVGADSVDLVDKILNADNAVLSKGLLNNGVVGESDTLLVDLAVSTLVDELLDRLQVRVAVGDPGLDNLEHLGGGLGNLDEDTVVDLEETEELKNLAGLGGHLVDTLDTDDKDQLGFSGDVGRVVGLGGTMKADLLTLSIAILLNVLLSTLKDDATLLLVGSLLLLDGGSALGAGLLLRLALLEKSLRDQDLVVGRDTTIRLVRSPKTTMWHGTERRCENCCNTAFSALANSRDEFGQ